MENSEPEQRIAPVRASGSKKFRWWCVVLIFGAVGIAAGVLLWPDRSEPMYGGNKLSAWLFCVATNMDQRRMFSEAVDHYDFDAAALPEAKEAAQAVRRIGKDGIPCMLSWIGYEPPRWRLAICQFADKLPVPAKYKPSVREIVGSKAADRAVLAYFGLWILGPEARSAVPELSRTMNRLKDTNSRRMVMFTLARLGEPGFPPLAEVLTNVSHPDHAVLGMNLDFVYHLGTNVHIAVPVLIKCLTDEDSRVENTAADVLDRLIVEPAILLPALTNVLRGTNAVMRARALFSIGKFGKRAASAGPAVVDALDDSDAMVRSTARTALRKVAPDLIPEEDERWKSDYRPKR
jgi:hypothetical protein